MKHKGGGFSKVVFLLAGLRRTGSPRLSYPILTV